MSGVTIAAPNPCTARAAISHSADRAMAAAADAAGEEADAEHEHPLATEPVSERRPVEHEDREGQRVGVDRPLELLQ